MAALRLVFDLDDTLYPERDFALGGFRAAATFAERAFGAAPGLEQRMADLLDSGHLGGLFKIALGAVKPDFSAADLQSVMDAYRDHQPRLTLFPDAQQALHRYGRTGTLGLITDGTAEIQRAKIAALAIADRFAEIICTDALGGRAFFKPHAKAFAMMATALGRSGDRFVYVGDNPAKDFVAPNAMGWTTIMIRRPGARLIHANAETAAGGAAQHVVASLEDLDRVIGM